MRTLSTTLTDKISKKFGMSTTVFIGIDWNGGGETLYSSETSDKAGKALVDLGSLDTTQIVSGNGATQSVTVTLSDTDGMLSDMLSRVDIHKRPAKVYLGFDGIDPDLSVVLLDGEVNSPIEWDEHARTLKFTIVNKIEGRLFGFAMEDGYFLRVPDRYRSKPWPFRYGETCAYPAVRVANGTTGVLTEGQGVLDPSLDARICQAQNIDCPYVAAGDGVQSSVSTLTGSENITNAINTWRSYDPFSTDQYTKFGEDILPENSSQSVYNANGTTGIQQKDPECERAAFTELCQLLRSRANQLVFVQNTLNIFGGEKFPQGVETSIQVKDVNYTGTFDGEEFTILTTNRQDAPTNNPDCAAASDWSLSYRKANESEPNSLAECATPTETLELVAVGGTAEAWRNLAGMESPGFTWLPAGTEVRLTDSSTEVHVVSLTAGTVDTVYAYRTLGDESQLTELPTDYYTIAYVSYGPFISTEIHIDRPLSSYKENWEDTIYCGFTATLSPNPALVLKSLIATFTDFTVDDESFDTAEALLANYPCNYYYAQKSNILAVLQKIAYEARCALTITDNVVKLTYLPLEPSSDRTITTADIIAGSFNYELTRTESLQTSSKTTFNPSGASILKSIDPTRTFTVENNVSKYGWVQGNNDYDTINNEGQAIKTATFWSIRDSSTWKEVSFTTTLEHLDVELYDCLTLDVPSFPTVKTIVKTMTVDTSRGTIAFSVWTPILSGTNVEYKWAWPADKGVEPYPVGATDYQAEGIVMTPPVGHPLYIADPNAIVPPIVGDRFPTDVDDEYPVLICPEVTDPLIKDAVEPDFVSIDFEAQATRSEAEAQNGLNWGESDDNEENVVCGRPSLETDVWEVTTQYAHSVTSIAERTAESGSGIDNCNFVGGSCKKDKVGARCSGEYYFWCRTFGSEAMAQAYRDMMLEQIYGQFCSWTIGKIGPVGVQGPTHRSTGPSVDAQTGIGEAGA
jgi:hypothetical protein